MIRYKIDISQKECDALIEIQLKHSVSRGIQNFFRIVLAILAISWMTTLELMRRVVMVLFIPALCTIRVSMKTSWRIIRQISMVFNLRLVGHRT